MFTVFLVCWAIAHPGLCIGNGGEETQCTVPFCESVTTLEDARAYARKRTDVSGAAQIYSFGLADPPHAKFIEIVKRKP